VDGAVPSGQGALPSRADPFENGLSALSSGLGTFLFGRRTAGGGIGAKQLRLHPGACLTVTLRGIPFR
jgi:hypothetical protein